MAVGSSTGMWSINQGPTLKEKLTLLPQEAINSQGWLDLMQVFYRQLLQFLGTAFLEEDVSI